MPYFGIYQNKNALLCLGHCKFVFGFFLLTADSLCPLGEKFIQNTLSFLFLTNIHDSIYVSLLLKALVILSPTASFTALNLSCSAEVLAVIFESWSGLM